MAGSPIRSAITNNVTRLKQLNLHQQLNRSFYTCKLVQKPSGISVKTETSFSLRVDKHNVILPDNSFHAYPAKPLQASEGWVTCSATGDYNADSKNGSFSGNTQYSVDCKNARTAEVLQLSLDAYVRAMLTIESTGDLS